MNDERPARVIWINKLADFLGVQRTQVDELVRAGRVHPFAMNEGGRAKVVLESEVVELQKSALAKANRERGLKS